MRRYFQPGSGYRSERCRFENSGAKLEGLKLGTVVAASVAV
jgi:hypothetical protein